VAASCPEPQAAAIVRWAVCAILYSQRAALLHRSQNRQQASPATPTTMRLLAYGDSLTAGYHSNGMAFSPWAPLLRKALSAERCDHVGHSGWTTYQMRNVMNATSCADMCGRRWPGLRAQLRAHGPYDAVLIMAGTNDLVTDARPEDILRNLEALHSAAHATGARTIALSVPQSQAVRSISWLRDKRNAVNRALAAWAAAQPNQRVLFLDTGLLLPFAAGAEPGSQFWEPDGLHMSAQGYAALAEHLAAALRDQPVLAGRITDSSSDAPPSAPPSPPELAMPPASPAAAAAAPQPILAGRLDDGSSDAPPSAPPSPPAFASSPAHRPPPEQSSPALDATPAPTARSIPEDEPLASFAPPTATSSAHPSPVPSPPSPAEVGEAAAALLRVSSASAAAVAAALSAVLKAGNGAIGAFKANFGPRRLISRLSEAGAKGKSDRPAADTHDAKAQDGANTLPGGRAAEMQVAQVQAAAAAAATADATSAAAKAISAAEAASEEAAGEAAAAEAEAEDLFAEVADAVLAACVAPPADGTIPAGAVGGMAGGAVLGVDVHQKDLYPDLVLMLKRPMGELYPDSVGQLYPGVRDLSSGSVGNVYPDSVREGYPESIGGCVAGRGERGCGASGGGERGGGGDGEGESWPLLRLRLLLRGACALFHPASCRFSFIAEPGASFETEHALACEASTQAFTCKAADVPTPSVEGTSGDAAETLAPSVEVPTSAIEGARSAATELAAEATTSPVKGSTSAAAAAAALTAEALHPATARLVLRSLPRRSIFGSEIECKVWPASLFPASLTHTHSPTSSPPTQFTNSCAPRTPQPNCARLNSYSTPPTPPPQVWPASVLLARWLFLSPWMVRHRAVLEIGAGVGVAGLTAALCGAKSVLLTDINGKALQVCSTLPRPAHSPAPLCWHAGLCATCVLLPPLAACTRVLAAALCGARSVLLTDINGKALQVHLLPPMAAHPLLPPVGTCRHSCNVRKASQVCRTAPSPAHPCKALQVHLLSPPSRPPGAQHVSPVL
jgi:lysophospholipase L1-like esterase